MSEKIRYLIRYHETNSRADEIISVPATWKVTFGPITPGNLAYAGNDGWTVRFYESKDKQRAVLQGVYEIRELDTMTVHRKVTQPIRDSMTTNEKGEPVPNSEIPDIGEWIEVDSFSEIEKKTKAQASIKHNDLDWSKPT